MRAMAWALLLAGCTSPPAAEPLLLNPFNDPFVQATHGRPCPAPRGPAYTEAQRLQEGHYRVERGTSCWLAGQCSEPNAYRYDARIAEAAVAALRGDPALAAGSSIWIIGERRFVYLQGCVADAGQAARAEAVVKAVPDVQLVIPSLSLPGEAARYPLP
jgi:hypothetical protein